MHPNKMQMFLNLQEWIEISGQSKSITVADSIWDSPHQNPDFAPYVVIELLKNTPRKQIPYAVLEKLKDELIKTNEYVEPKKNFFNFWRTKR